MPNVCTAAMNSPASQNVRPGASVATYATRRMKPPTHGPAHDRWATRDSRPGSLLSSPAFGCSAPTARLHSHLDDRMLRARPRRAARDHVAYLQSAQVPEEAAIARDGDDRRLLGHDD